MSMCENKCGSTCVCDWEEVYAIVDDDEFMDYGMTHLTNAVVYLTSPYGGYAVVGADVYAITRTAPYPPSATLLDGVLRIKDDDTYVKFVQTPEVSLPSILKG